MAPEVFEGESYSKHGDVWSFGMTILVSKFLRVQIS
jgi:serine/threonine protein kinase